MTEENQEQQPIPEERVFAIFRLYLDESGHIAGKTIFDGPKLKAMNVKPHQAVLCQHAAKHVHQDIQETIDHVSRMRGALSFLNTIFDRLGETDDSKDDSTEGSDDSRAASTGN